MSAVLVETGPDKGAIWHFGEPNKEQKELAAGNAWADLSHRGVLSVTGRDRLTWLHSLTTQHLEQIPLAKWMDALILDPQGHVIEQLFLVDDGVTTWIHIEAAANFVNTLSDDYGFKTDVTHFAIYGLCSKCAEKNDHKKRSDGKTK